MTSTRALVAASVLIAVPGASHASNATKEWKVERGTYQCSLTKANGPKFEIELSDSLSGPSFLAFRLGSSEFQLQPGEIVLLPSGSSFARKSAMWIPGGYVVSGLPSDFLSRFSQATDLVVNVGGKKKFAYNFASAGEAVRDLEACHDILLRSWGIDQAKTLSLAKQATPIFEGLPWIRKDELDKITTEAMARYGGGSTVISYTVQPDGHIADCRTVLSSGLPTLDAFACSSVLKHGRFEPALNAAGEPAAQRIADIYRWAFTRP